jgi:phosphohistidine phosphatase
MTSPAERALATALHYARQFGIAPEQLQRNPAQYAASVPALIRLLRTVDAGVGTLMLVGHNPASTALANALSGLRMETIPTSGIVALAFSQGGWANLTAGSGTLLFCDHPQKQE